MLVKRLDTCAEITAGDATHLREILHPDKEPLALRYSLAHSRLPAGRASLLHRLTSSEVYHVLAGRGRMEINGEDQEIGPGDTVYIPPHARQRIFSLGDEDLQFLCIVDPAWHSQDEEVI